MIGSYSLTLQPYAMPGPRIWIRRQRWLIRPIDNENNGCVKWKGFTGSNDLETKVCPLGDPRGF
jgi:hypothetical protein